MKLHDSLTRREKEVPSDRPITMYACGVTVYDYCHLGHARSYVVWDVLKRWLKRRQKVYHVQNFTDVDDKIVDRAAKEGVTSKELADRFIDDYFNDMGWLNVQKADLYPRVTDYMIPMKVAATALVESGHAYHKDGDIRFKTKTFPGYGKLSRRKTAEDFVLWKGPKANESEFPKGRPGWHLECSIMIERTIGFTVDIHVGGDDLKFPHHENEIAQSECLHAGSPLADIWLHNGMVQIGDRRMGKSEGNAVNIRDYRANGTDPNVIRFWILSASYAKPLSVEGLLDGTSAQQWKALRNRLKSAPEHGVSEDFAKAMDANLNTSEAIAATFVNPSLEQAELLGFQMFSDEDAPDDAIQLAKLREECRRQRNWAGADALKRRIIDLGCEIRDRSDGSSVVLKK
jgi:cysteinyl-tRNA synthetase